MATQRGSTSRANQRVTPTGVTANGASWKWLGTVTVNSGWAVVKLTNAANGQVCADAVRIERVQTVPTVPQPEIGLAVNGGGLTSGQGVVNFGSTPIGAPQTRVFTVTNQGTAPLTLSALSILVPGFSLAQNFGATTLASGASTTFSLRLDAGAAGSFGGWLSVSNNDSDENPFWIQVAGTVSDPNAPFTQIIDDGSPGHSLAGTWTRNATKGYAGDILTAAAGNGSVQSNWAFTSVPNGTYQIWATWKVGSTNATNAPFSLYDGGQLVSTVRKDQRQTPSIWDGTTFWESLGTLTVTNGWLVVRLTNSANGSVVADAIRIQQVVPGGAALLAAPPAPSGPAPAPAPVSSELAWSSYAPAEYAPEARALDDAIDLLNEVRQAMSGNTAVQQLAADEVVREELTNVG